MKAKEKYRQILIEHMANPDNQFLTRGKMAEVCKIKRTTLYMHFTPKDLTLIEREALDLRRTKYAKEMAGVDISLIKRAQKGDVQAAKLAYQRFENWSEKQKHEIGGEGGGPVQINITRIIIDPQEKKE